MSQRFPEPCSPTVSAARPSQSRLGAHQCWSRGPSRPNEPPHAGGAVHNSSRTGGRSARGGPRVVRCCRRRAVTPPPGSQFVSAVVSPGNRDSKRIPRVRRVGKPQRFPEPSSPTVAAAQPPTSRLAPSWGSRAGCPASTTPLTRAGQPPRRNQGARRRAVPRPHDVLWPAGSQARDLAGPPGTKADEARLLGGGGDGPHRCPRPGVESCRPPVSGPSTKEGDVNPPVTSGSATKIALVTAMLDGRCLFSHFHENRGTVA